jgi:hypothetical protein
MDDHENAELMVGFPVAASSGRQSYMALFQDAGVAYKSLMKRLKAAEQALGNNGHFVPVIPAGGTTAEREYLRKEISRKQKMCAAQLKFELTTLVLDFAGKIDARSLAEMTPPHSHSCFGNATTRR